MNLVPLVQSGMSIEHDLGKRSLNIVEHIGFHFRLQIREHGADINGSNHMDFECTRFGIYCI
jgi:hypothetical protein